ncbi:MAG: efflux RND transporter periplasmic adaptor subunit [Candidatus Binatia bacterium]
MNRRSLGTLILAVVVTVAAGYLWRSHGSQQASGEGAAVAQGEPSQAPIASVQVDRITQGTLAKEITVYGTIVPAAGALQTITVPYESRVQRILVAEGQQVSRGDPLLEIAPSWETRLQTRQARNDYETAQKGLQFMQQRLDLKLATNDQLLQAQQTLEQAQAKMESTRGRGSETPQEIHADAASLISKISVQRGAIVPAGNAMIEMVAQGRAEARVGVEPADRAKVRAGQEVRLGHVNEPERRVVVGKIRLLAQAANAANHLIDGFIDLPSAADFIVNESVVGKITVAHVQGLLVPRSALLPEGDHFVLFTVKAGRAEQHKVEIRLENGNQAEVSGENLQVGAPVVTLGNYELRDGMSVKVDASR